MKLLTLAKAGRLCGLHGSTIRSLIRTEAFPEPLIRGATPAGDRWEASLVEKWRDDRLAEIEERARGRRA